MIHRSTTRTWSNSESNILPFAKFCLVLSLLVCALAGCREASSRSPGTLDDNARQYIRLAVALGERDPDALDYYVGPDNLTADIRRNPPKLTKIKQSATELSNALAGMPTFSREGEQRKRFLSAQIHAIAARADLVLRVQSSLPKSSFDEEVYELFGVRFSRQGDSRLSAVRRQIAVLLGPGHGTLAERYSSFEQKLLIPEERIPAVMARSLEFCRKQSLLHLKLPAGESVRLEYVRNKPWRAFSYYKGRYQSVIQVNVDLGLTPDGALQLACHEGYPGHHVFNSLAEENMVRTRHRLEWSVQPTFSPQSFLSEAAASFAGELAFSASERAQIEQNVLFPLAHVKWNAVPKAVRIQELVDSLHPAELAIAREYLDERLEYARAGQAFQEQALMQNPDPTLRYLNEYRSYVVTYTEGRDRVMDWVDAHAGNPPDRWRAFADLLASPDLF